MTAHTGSWDAAAAFDGR